MHVREAREQYVRWLLVTKDMSPHTIRAYDGDVAAFERHAGADLPVAVIDRARLVAFLEHERAAGLSPRSIRRRAAGLRGFCRWLRTSGHLAEDPWIGAAVAAGRARKLPRLLASHELDALLAHLCRATGWDRARPSLDVADRPHEATTLLGVTLMVATGVRVHEVVGLRCQDIDLAADSLRIVGKGRRERQVFLPNDWVRALTRAYLHTRAELGVGHARLLFNTRHGPLTEAAMRTRLAKAARGAGITARVTPHMLRHTAATQLIEAGVDIRYIQRLLGHASLSTTEIYTHVSDAALRRVVAEADVLGRRLPAG